MTTIPQHDLREISDSSNLDRLAYIDNADLVVQARTTAKLRLLWEQRRFLFRGCICGLVVFTAVAFLIPKRFESTVQLMPPDDQSASGMMMAAALANKISGSLGGIAGDILGGKSSGDLFVGIMRSRTVQDDVVRKLDLKKVYKSKQWETTRNRLAENTMISQDRKSGIIMIAVSDRSPERAAAIAGEYVNELNRVVSQLSTSSAHRERVFLEERLAQVKQDLQAAEKDFSEFASKNGTVDIKEQGRAMVEGAATVEGELIAAQSELQGLKQIYAENNVRVRSVRARIAELQNQLGQLGGKQEISKEATTPDRDELYPSIRKLPLLGVPYADLYRRMRVQEAVFESLTQEYELAKVAEAKEIPSVKVLDPPNLPEKKSFPPRLTVIALGTILCCATACLWVFGKARWEEIPEGCEQKVLARDVLRTINAKMPWVPPHGIAHQAWVKLTRKPMHSEENISKS